MKWVNQLLNSKWYYRCYNLYWVVFIIAALYHIEWMIVCCMGLLVLNVIMFLYDFYNQYKDFYK